MILNKTFFVVPDSLEEGCARVTLYEKGRVNVNDMIIQRFLERTTTKLPLFEVINSFKCMLSIISY